MQASALYSTPVKAGMIDILQELYGDSWRTPNILKNEKIQEELNARQPETNLRDKSKTKKTSYRENTARNSFDKTSSDDSCGTSNNHKDYYYQIVERKANENHCTSKQKESLKYMLGDASSDEDLHYSPAISNFDGIMQNSSETRSIKKKEKSSVGKSSVEKPDILVKKPNYSRIPTDSEDEEPLILKRKNNFNKIVISSDEEDSIIKIKNNDQDNIINEFVDNASSSENEIIENSICISESDSDNKTKLVNPKSYFSTIKSNDEIKNEFPKQKSSDTRYSSDYLINKKTCSGNRTDEVLENNFYTPKALSRNFKPKSKMSSDDSFIVDSDSSSVDSFENTPAFYNRLDFEIKKSSVKKSSVRKIKAPIYKYHDSDSESDNIMSATICDIENDDIDDIADNFDDVKISGGISKDSLNDVIKKLDFQDTQKSTKKSKTSSNIKRVSSLSFLESLSENVDIQQCHVDAIPYKKNFKKTKQHLTQTLFELFNRKVFDGKLHQDLQIIWCNNLRTTAGFCKPKRFFIDGEVTYKCSIRLSTKVVDRPCRVRDTLIHELCHAANFEIDRIRDAKHGQRWKYWTRKAERCFPELQEISVKHDYVIEYNFIYECDTCHHRVYRHKNTMNANENCGCGFGNYKGFRKQTDGTLKPIESSTRKPSAFAMFVKENYGSVKSTFSNHKDCMKELSNLYAKQKNRLS